MGKDRRSARPDSIAMLRLTCGKSYVLLQVICQIAVYFFFSFSLLFPKTGEIHIIIDWNMRG